MDDIQHKLDALEAIKADLKSRRGKKPAVEVDVEEESDKAPDDTEPGDKDEAEPGHGLVEDASGNDVNDDASEDGEGDDEDEDSPLHKLALRAAKSVMGKKG